MYQDRPVVNPFLATLLVALVLVSVVLSGIAFVGVAAREPAPEPERAVVETVVAPDPEIALLRERVEALERKVTSMPKASTGHIEEEVRKLRQDVSELSRGASRKSSSTRSGSGSRDQKKILTEPERLVLVRMYRRQATDTGHSAAKRLHALKMLKAYGGRTTEVALSMFALLQQTDDPALRLEILQNLRGMEGSQVAQYLMDILRADSHTAVREEAADSLRIFVENEEVRLALDQAGRSDPSGTVRQIAMDVLASPPPAGDGSD